MQSEILCARSQLIYENVFVLAFVAANVADTFWIFMSNCFVYLHLFLRLQTIAARINWAFAVAYKALISPYFQLNIFLAREPELAQRHLKILCRLNSSASQRLHENILLSWISKHIQRAGLRANQSVAA